MTKKMLCHKPPEVVQDSLATSGSKFVRRTSQAQTFERRTAELSLSLEGAPNKKV
jgi:hypothetical protein